MGTFTKLEVYIDGSHAGEISADGDLWADGERQGQIDGDSVWRRGECIAQLGADGIIWLEGSQIGTLESDGSLWLEGERLASFEDDGEVWVAGERRAVVTAYENTSENRRALVIFCLFFTNLFEVALGG